MASTHNLEQDWDLKRVVDAMIVITDVWMINSLHRGGGILEWHPEILTHKLLILTDQDYDNHFNFSWTLGMVYWAQYKIT